MSAESLLADPALFSSVPATAQPWAACPAAKTTYLMEQYLDLCDGYPVVDRMVRTTAPVVVASSCWLTCCSAVGIRTAYCAATLSCYAPSTGFSSMDNVGRRPCLLRVCLRPRNGIFGTSKASHTKSASAVAQVRGHVHKMLGSWLAEFTDLRRQLVQPPWPSPAGLRALTVEVRLCQRWSSCADSAPIRPAIELGTEGTLSQTLLSVLKRPTALRFASRQSTGCSANQNSQVATDMPSFWFRLSLTCRASIHKRLTPAASPSVQTSQPVVPLLSFRVTIIIRRVYDQWEVPLVTCR